MAASGDDFVNDRSNLGVIQDSRIVVQVGKKFREVVEDVVPDKKQWDGKQILSLPEIKELWKEIHGSQSLRDMESVPRRKVYLHEMLMGSDIMIPKLEVPERNPELEKRVAALRNSLAEREYQRMTQNVNPSSRNRFDPEDTIGAQLKQMNSSMIAVLQFIISIACAFFFGFKGIEMFIGGLELPVRLLLGIGIALTVGAAELYFLALNIAVSEKTEWNTGEEKVVGGPATRKPNIPIETSEHLKTS